MPLWTFGSVEQEPSVHLVSWKVVEIDAGTRHFVGADALDRTGRVSSAIVQLDLTAKRGVTRSGRVYKLVGEPGHTGDGNYVWTRWCEINGVRSFTDVTQEMLEAKGDAGASISED